MNDKTILIIGAAGVAYLLMMRSSQARAAQLAAQQRANTQGAAINTAAQAAGALGKFFSGFTAGASKPWGGNVPSVAVARAASSAAQSDSDPRLNGSISEMIFNDGIALNPPGVSSVYDYVNQYSYGY